MSLTPTSKSNPCPICEDIAGKCRQGRDDSDYWQCMTYADARKGEIHNGYKCLGHTRDQLWAQFRLDNSQEWSEQQRIEWQRENQRRRNEKAKEDEQRQRRSLTAAQRHEQYTRLLGELTLNPDDRADLVRRGFTHEQIELSGFKSIERCQQLQSQYSKLLPGMASSSRLVIREEGYLCPVRNLDGLIVACQVRLRTLPTSETNRYRWLSGHGQTLHFFPEGCKSEGELPLAVHIPQKLNKFAIGICEGVGAKPFLASQRLGIPFIGAAGGQHASSPEIFKSSLQQIEEALWEVAQENGLGSTTRQQQPRSQKESQSLVNKDNQFKTVQKYQKQLSNIGTELDRSVIKSQSSCLTSNSSQWLKKKLSDSLVKILNSTDSKCNPSEILSYQLAESQSQFQIKLVVTPDAGDILNPSVMNRWQRVIALLEGWGWSVEIAWWNQTDKSHPDVDELDDLTKIEFISPLDFLKSQKKGFNPESEKGKTENSKHYIKPIEELPKTGFHVIRRSQDELLQIFDALKTKRGQEWLQLRKFTPDVTINSQYFNYDFKPEENLATNSGLGTGKSYFTNAKWLANPDDGAVLGGYRNCLNEQFCANGEKLNGRPWYQIQVDLKNSQDAALISDPHSRIAGAVDSWIYFAPHHFHGKKVIFDEVESVAKHLNQSSTAVAFYREIIKDRVSNALTSSTANLIADGNLRDFTVEYFEKLSGGKKFTKILNTYTGNRGKVYLYNGSSRKRKATEEDVKNGLAIKVDDWISFDHKPDDFSKLHRVMVDLPIDIPLLVLSDSQKKCEAWDRELSAKGRKVFRLDSTTSTSDLGRLFLTDPKSFILSEKIDTVILSPSAESGVSIELLDELGRKIPGYFKYEFAFFFGVSVTDIQTQFLGRNRDPYTNKFVYVQTHSMPITRQITDEENSQDIFSMWAETMKDCASLSLQGLEEGEILKIALEKIKAQLLDPHTQYESKLLLKESFEQKHPRFCLEYALRESGWEVLTVESRQDDLSDLRAIEQEIAEQKAIAVFSAEEVTSTEADQLARKLNKTPEERNQITKSQLIGRLPGIKQKIVTEEKRVTTPEQLQKLEESEIGKIVTIAETPYEDWKASSQSIPDEGLEILIEKPAFNPEFINKVLNKDRYFINRLESQFLLRNPEICKLIQQHKWHKKLDLLTDPDSVSFGGLPISRYRSKWLEIHTLYQMGIAFFLNPENSWHNESPEALSFWQQGKIPRNARNVGVKHEDDPCTYIGKVLKKFGLKTQELKQKTRPDGTRYREYSIREIDSLSQAVYECVEQRIKNQVSEFNFDWKKIVKNSGFKTAETFDQQGLQAAHLQQDNYIKARVEVCDTSGIQQQSGGSEKITSPIDSLIDIFKICDSNTDFTEVAKFYEAPNPDGGQRLVEQKEDLIISAILHSPREIKARLQLWWDSTCLDVKDFWRGLELSAAGM